MPDTHIAESILRLVTSPDRAASTVGDLLEGAETRGSLWFWAAILRTAASLLWLAITENPVRLVRQAGVVLAIDLATSVVLPALTGILFFIVLVMTGPGQRPQFNSIWWGIGLNAPTLIISLLLGRMLARRAPRRELAACVVYALLASLVGLTLMLINAGSIIFLIWGFLGDVALRTPVLAGVVWERHRTLAAR